MTISLNPPMTQNVLFTILKTQWKSFLSLVFEALMVSPSIGPSSFRVYQAPVTTVWLLIFLNVTIS